MHEADLYIPVCEKLGWPEWEHCGSYSRLWFDPKAEVWGEEWIEHGPRHFFALDPYIALCILENWANEKMAGFVIAERWDSIQPNPRFCLQDGAEFYLMLDGHWDPCFDKDKTALFDTITEARIAFLWKLVEEQEHERTDG